ncbi:hypothetical protein E1508_08495 [Pseudomonas moraviensis]|nr:hypothetical protein E1508_08495 [Pseudomonas moraviensis]
MGASLLAKASCQSMQMLNDRPLSRAGSLPHWQSCLAVRPGLATHPTCPCDKSSASPVARAGSGSSLRRQ